MSARLPDKTSGTQRSNGIFTRMSSATALAMLGSVGLALLSVGGLASPHWYFKAAGVALAVCMGLLVRFVSMNSKKDRDNA